MTENLLSFGWTYGLVPGTKAAWGARLIVTQDGTTDLLHDRQSAGGDETLVTKTLEWLNTKTVARYPDEDGGNPVGKARKVAERLLKDYTMKTNKAKGFVLYQDEQGAIVGNTNGSCGYLYIAAYLYESLPEGHPTKGLEMAQSFEEE